LQIFELGEVVRNGIVEIETALLQQRERGDGGDDLRHRGDGENAVLPHGCFGGEIAVSGGPARDDLAVAEDDPGGAGEVAAGGGVFKKRADAVYPGGGKTGGGQVAGERKFGGPERGREAGQKAGADEDPASGTMRGECDAANGVHRSKTAQASKAGKLAGVDPRRNQTAN
jgi:hypothetical protein